MPFGLSFRSVTIKARLISSYLVILAIGGLVTSLVGSWIVSSTIMAQAQRSVNRDLATARALYEEQLYDLQRTLQVAALGGTIQRYMTAGDHRGLLAYLSAIRGDAQMDFLSLADASGRVLLRVSQPARGGDDASSIAVVKAALGGRAARGTEILAAGQLAAEDPALCDRARFRLLPTPRARPLDKAEETSGMVLMAAAPVRSLRREVMGALYGGILLNRNFGLVDRVWELVLKGDRYQGRDVGTVTIFQDDVRISTNVKTPSGERALGTRVSEEVYDAVVRRGGTWRGRAFVVHDWYISAYDPIRSYDGRVVGMLYVGLLEEAYTSVRDRVILSFFGIATTGFILIIGITYYMIRSITRPIAEMVAATRNIAAGRFDQEVQTDSTGEIAILAESFNAMQKSLRQMRADLEEWGRTLEEKVKQRTEELVAMHDRVAQQERLASLGKLAAGVAHEINNPLGGVLALTALALEDMPKHDPNRENLEEVLRQAERCRRIVKSLLEFSRQSQPRTELCDLNKVLQDTLALVTRQAIFFNVNVVTELDPQLAPVMADRSQIQQVFMNILMNAVEAMEERGTVTIVTRTAPDGFVEVAISDTGCGIPPERIDRIFDPFFTTKAPEKGTGLGLSIAYGIVADHQGTIAVQSEVGKGSTFTVRLPAAAQMRSGATR